MKYLAAVFGLVWAAASAAPPIPVVPMPVVPLAVPMPMPLPVPGSDLRRALQQYDPDGTASPRQLSPAEREQLRKQLSEYGTPPQRTPRR